MRHTFDAFEFFCGEVGEETCYAVPDQALTLVPQLLQQVWPAVGFESLDLVVFAVYFGAVSAS